VLVARNFQSNNLVRLLPLRDRNSAESNGSSKGKGWRETPFGIPEGSLSIRPDPPTGIRPEQTSNQTFPAPNLDEIDPLYLLGCEIEWGKRGNATAAWEVISAARSSNESTRAHARSLLERSQERGTQFPEDDNGGNSIDDNYERPTTMEAGMRTP
jgi:hypothetical protein